MDRIVIAGVTMPRTRSLEIGGEYEAKEKTMASGKMVRDVQGWRKKITANWEWLPAGLLAQLVPLARSGQFLTVQYPDSTGQDAQGRFSVSIGNQKVFRYRNRQPYWYNVELTAVAQEVEHGNNL